MPAAPHTLVSGAGSAATTGTHELSNTARRTVARISCRVGDFTAADW
jgi:hypothetical protein